MNFIEALKEILTKNNVTSQLSPKTSLRTLKSVIKVEFHVDPIDTKQIILNKRRILILGFKDGVVKETDPKSLVDLVEKVTTKGEVLIIHQGLHEIESSTSKSCVTYKFPLMNEKYFSDNTYKFYSICWNS